MAVTYILHGGETSRENEFNDAFFQEFTKHVDKDEVHILHCLFSQEKEKWDELFQRLKSAIEAQTSKKVVCTIAQDPLDLLNKLGSHDVLYVAGGQAELIEPVIPHLENLHNLMQNKVYIGSSMGAFIASSQYVLSFETQEDTQVHYGLGLVPLSTLCHWDIEKKKQTKIDLLKNAAPTTPILTLDECKYSIFVH